MSRPLKTWFCVACGKPYQFNQSHQSRRYCSDACRPDCTKPKNSDEAISQVVTMWNAGKSYHAISRAVGVADKTVARWVDGLCDKGILTPRTKTRQRVVAERILFARQPTATRNCLKCRDAFQSEGPHNRICDGCKSGSVWQSGCSYGFAA